jgi:hypothetical protein
MHVALAGSGVEREKCRPSPDGARQIERAGVSAGDDAFLGDPEVVIYMNSLERSILYQCLLHK